MKVSELFYSIQGEGPSAGKPTVFLRLAGCNLRCTFCDSKYSWEEGKEMSIEEVKNEILKYNCNRLCITGGEPLLQKDDLILLCSELDNLLIEIETNGTICPCDICEFVDLFVVSPKLSNSGIKYDNRIIDIVLREYSCNPRIMYVLKFVINTSDDMNEVNVLVKKMGTIEHYVYLMPEGTNPKQIEMKSPEIIELCKKYGFNYSPRLQIMFYGNIRGK